MENTHEIEGFANLQEQTKQANILRQKMVDKLIPVIEDMQITPGQDKSTITEVKLNVLKTVDDLLKSGESALATNVKIALQNKKVDADDKHAEVVAQMLKEMSTKIKPVAVNNQQLDDVDNKLEETFQTSKEDISEAELETNDIPPESEDED